MAPQRRHHENWGSQVLEGRRDEIVYKWIQMDISPPLITPSFYPSLFLLGVNYRPGDYFSEE